MGFKELGYFLHRYEALSGIMVARLTQNDLKVERQVDFFTRINSSVKPDAFAKGLKDFYPDKPSKTSMPFAIPSIIRKIFNNKVP